MADHQQTLSEEEKEFQIREQVRLRMEAQLQAELKKIKEKVREFTNRGGNTGCTCVDGIQWKIRKKIVSTPCNNKHVFEVFQSINLKAFKMLIKDHFRKEPYD